MIPNLPRMWQTVGRRLAFRDRLARPADMTPDFEEKILLYASHLMGGGAPFNARSSGGGRAKATKTTTTPKTRTQSRSRSRGPIRLGKNINDKMYVMRKKSFSKPSTERVEIVEREFVTESDSDGRPPRRLLLPAPTSPTFQLGAQYVEIKPPGRSSSSSSNGSSDNGGRGPGPARSPRPSPPTSPPRGGAAFHQNFPSRERQGYHEDPRPEFHPPLHSARRNDYETSKEGLFEHRQRVLARIRDEADAAVAELERKIAASRDERRNFRRSMRPPDYRLSPEQEREEDTRDDIREMCDIIGEDYGVRIEELPPGTRDPIFAPRVRAAAPLPEEEVEAEIRIHSRTHEGGSKKRKEKSKASRLSS